MGDYAPYIYAAYGIAGVVMSIMTLQSWLAWRRVKARDHD